METLQIQLLYIVGVGWCIFTNKMYIIKSKGMCYIGFDFQQLLICLFCVFLNNGQYTKMNCWNLSSVHTEYQHHRHKCVIISD